MIVLRELFCGTLSPCRRCSVLFCSVLFCVTLGNRSRAHNEHCRAHGIRASCALAPGMYSSRQPLSASTRSRVKSLSANAIAVANSRLSKYDSASVKNAQLQHTVKANCDSLAYGRCGSLYHITHRDAGDARKR